MPQPDYGLPVIALIAAFCWAVAAVSLAANLGAVAAVLAVVPVVAGSYRERWTGAATAVAAAPVFGVLSLWAAAPLVAAVSGALAVLGLGLFIAATIGSAADEATAYRVWYHGLRDRLPAATLFFMPATGRIPDLNEQAVALLGPLRSRSFAEVFADARVYDAFAADVASGDVVHRGAWLTGADGSSRYCELSGAMATQVLAVVSIDDRTVERSAADALAASEAAHRSLVAGIPGAALFVDENLQITAAGGALLASLAGTEEPVAGRTLWTAFPDRIAQALEPLARLAAFGTPGTADLKADGRHLLIAAAPFQGEDGCIFGAAVAASDVTPLSARLDECEEGHAIANALLAVCRADGADAAARLLSASLRLTGSRYGAVLRRDGTQLAPLALSPALADADLRVLAGDAASTSEPAVREGLPHAPLPLRRILSVPVGSGGVIVVADRSTPYTDREVTQVGTLADGGFDAAARSAAAAETEARAEAFRSLLEAAPLPLVVTDRDGRVSIENDASRSLFGEGAPESLALRIASADRNRVLTAEDRRRRGARGTPTQYSATVLDANGRARPCLITAVYRRRNDETILMFLDLGTVADFDACRERAIAALEARLEEAIGSPCDDPAAFVEAVRAAWRASAGERAVLAAVTPFDRIPSDCAGYS